jgi:UDP-2,3-diacylglucosamine hydrolase
VITIKDGAFIVSDAHYSQKRLELLDFFKDIQNQKLQPTQLILMGDIFDVLIGGVPNTIKKNQEIVDVLNDISKKIQVLYLEGNHDFNLAKIFKDIEVFKLTQQPLECLVDGNKAYLAHGDFNAGFWYKVYTAFIRNQAVLFVLKQINSLFNNMILNKLDAYLDKKDDCKKIKNFEQIIKNRLENKFECKYFIEGHFHQNKQLKFKNFNYINLPAFACNQRYFRVKFANKELLQCNRYLRDKNDDE